MKLPTSHHVLARPLRPRPRRRSFTLAAAAVALVLAACGHGPPPAGSFPDYVESSLEGYHDGSFKKGKLRAATSVDGYPCRGWVHRRASGGLTQIRLAKSSTVLGQTIPAESLVYFDDQGHPETVGLSEDTVIDGHECRGGSKIHTGLHPNGRLRLFFSRRDVEIDGITCTGSVMHPIRLHANGRLASCKLAAGATIDGTRLAAGTKVQMDPEGHLTSAD